MSTSRLVLPPQPAVTAATTFANGAMAADERRPGHPDRYPCFDCSEHFADAEGRAAHMRTAHNIDDGFLCHTCVDSFSDARQYLEHLDGHFRTGWTVPLMTCTQFMCGYQTTSRDLWEQHRREDHLLNGSHVSKCPECEYRNDSVVGISVHMLHVHSRRGAAKREEEARRRRAAEGAARRAAARAAAAAASAARSSQDSATTDASSDTVGSSPAEAANGTAPPASLKRALPSEAASDAFLAQQMAIRDAMSKEERDQVDMTHRARKKAKKAAVEKKRMKALEAKAKKEGAS